MNGILNGFTEQEFGSEPKINRFGQFNSVVTKLGEEFIWSGFQKRPIKANSTLAKSTRHDTRFGLFIQWFLKFSAGFLMAK